MRFEFILAVHTNPRDMQVHGCHPPSIPQTGTARVHCDILPGGAPALAPTMSAQPVMAIQHCDTGRRRSPQKCRVLLLDCVRLTAAPHSQWRNGVLVPGSRIVHPQHPSGNFSPRDGSFAVDVFLKRDKLEAADNQYFFSSHRGGHKYAVSFTCIQLTAHKQKQLDSFWSDCGKCCVNPIHILLLYPFLYLEHSESVHW